MKKYLELIRINHWVKNVLIFLPMIAANALTNFNVKISILGFFSFSFMCSVVYIVNDIKDIEKDRLHPRKKKRPLPSGKIKISMALLILLIMGILSITICFLISKNTILPILLLISYMMINIFYSMGLKNVAILDVILLTTGFVLRVYYGAAIVNIEVSNWLFLTILTASLFLGLGKRKKELIHNKNSRKVLEEYNESFLDKFQYVALSLMLVFYSLWTMEQSNNYFVFTIPILITIFMKYSLIVEKSDEGDPTTILYKDKFLLSLCLLYGILMIVLLTVI